MKEIEVAAFLTQFKRELIQFQGLISFALLAYWIATLWTPLLTKMRSSRMEAFWVFFCMTFRLIAPPVIGAD